MIAATLAGLAVALAAPADDPIPPAPAPPPASAFAAPGDEAAQDLFVLADARPYRVRLRVLVGDRPFRAAWRDGVRAAHARLDADRDGKLTVAEADRRGLALLGSPAAPVRPSGEVDADKDGAISVDELAAALGGASGALRVQAEGAVDRRADALFDHLDRDKDGQVARSELATAAGTLRQLDRDDDELLDAAEVAAGTSAGPAVAPAMPGMGRSPAGGVGVPPLAALAAGESPLRLARLLMKKYDTKSARGGSKPDSRLAPEEFAIPPAAFAAVDANGDGQLSADELRRYLADGPVDAALDVAFPAEGDGPAAVVVRGVDGGAPAGLAARAVAPGLAEVEAGLFRLDVLADDGRAGAEAARRELLALFRAADASQDDYVDAAELAPDDGQTPASPLAPLLGPLDADGDGKLYAVDLEEYATRRAAEARGTLTLAAVDAGRSTFGLLDRDGDRRLGAREVLGAAARLAGCDVDGDGRVAPEEVPHHVQVTITRGDPAGLVPPPAPNPNGVVVVVNGPTRAVAAPSRPAPVAGPGWFRRMDRNRDGDVSRREFLGTIPQFDRLDRDGDGLLGPAEAEAAANTGNAARPPVRGPGG